MPSSVPLVSRPGQGATTAWERTSVTRVAPDVTLQPGVVLSAGCPVQGPLCHGGIPSRRGRFTICNPRRAAALAVGDPARRRRSVLDRASRLVGDEWWHSARRSTSVVVRSAHDHVPRLLSASTRGPKLRQSTSTGSSRRWYWSVPRSRSANTGRRHQRDRTVQPCPLNSCSPSTFPNQPPVAAEQTAVIIRSLACDHKRHCTST